MYVKANAYVRWPGSFEKLLETVEQAAGTSLTEDKSGDFEEAAAFTGRFLDLELVLFGTQPDMEEPAAENVYQIVIMTLPPVTQEEIESEVEAEVHEDIDLSENLVRVLRRQGLACSATPPPGTLGWFHGVRY